MPLQDRQSWFAFSQKIFDQYFSSLPGVHLSSIALAAEYADELSQEMKGLSTDEDVLLRHAALFYLTLYFTHSPIDIIKFSNLFEDFLIKNKNHFNDMMGRQWVDELRIGQISNPLYVSFEKKILEKATIGTERINRMRQYEKLLRKHAISRARGKYILPFLDANSYFEFKQFILNELKVKISTNDSTFAIVLTSDQYTQLKNTYRSLLPVRLPEDVFIIKTVATHHQSSLINALNNFDYFREAAFSLTRSATQKKKFHYRRAEKGFFVVKGNKVHDRKTKKPLYTAQEKGDRSQPQSTSWGMKDYGPPSYGGIAKDIRKKKSTGVKIARKDGLPGDFSLYDGGTVNGPNRFYDRVLAEAWFQEKTQGRWFYKEDGTKIYIKKPVLFKDEASFIQALRGLSEEEKKVLHNEVLTRLQFNDDGTSEICIFSEDDLDENPHKELSDEAVWLALDRKRILEKRCNDRALENKTVRNNEYDIPISLYKRDVNCVPRFERYDLFDQFEAKLKAKEIYHDKEKRLQYYRNSQYEFLLALDCKNPIDLLFEEVYFNAWGIKRNRQSLIIKMLYDGDVHIVQSLLERATPDQLEKFKKLKPKIGSTISKYTTQLVDLSAKAGCTLLVEWLLEKKIFSFSPQALIDASERQYHDIVKRLVDHGAPLTANDGSFPHYTPLHWAVHNNDIELINYFLSFPKRKVNIMLGSCQDTPKIRSRRTPIELAAHLGNWDLVKKLLKHIESEKSFLERDPYHLGQTLLRAVAADKQDVVDALLAKNAIVHVKSYDYFNGNNVLHWAIQNKNRKILELLVEANCHHPDRLNNLLLDENREKICPLTLAAEMGDWEIVNLLINRIKKSSYFSRYDQYTQLLALAIEKNQIKISNFLLDNNTSILSDFFYTKDHGYTFLHLAVEKANFKLFEKVFERALKCDSIEKFLSKKDANNNTFLDLAVKLGKWEMVEIILSQCSVNKISLFSKAKTPISVNHMDINGNTILHLAIEKLTQASLKKIIHYCGRDIGEMLGKSNRQNLTPVDLAVSLGKLDAVTLLAKMKQTNNRGAKYNIFSFFKAKKSDVKPVVNKMQVRP